MTPTSLRAAKTVTIITSPFLRAYQLYCYIDICFKNGGGGAVGGGKKFTIKTMAYFLQKQNNRFLMVNSFENLAFGIATYTNDLYLQNWAEELPISRLNLQK
jgi:hypothetical protein